MQLVKLVVPRNIYDELKLHPNQTILLSNSEVTCNPDVRGTNVNTALNSEETSNQHSKPLLVEPENDDWRRNESFHENSPPSTLTLIVNAGNGTQKILTYHLNSIKIVSTVQSGSEPESTFKNSDDTGPPIKDLNSVICEPHTQENNETAFTECERTPAEPDTCYNNDSTSIKPPREYLEPLLSMPEANEKSDDGESKESTIKNLDSSFIAVVNGEQEVLTYNGNSTLPVSNEQDELVNISKKSDDMITSTKENNSIFNNSLVLKMTESNEKPQHFLSPCGNTYVLRKMFVSGDSRNIKKTKLKAKNEMFVRGDSRNIKKTKLEAKNEIVCPIHCTECNRIYKNNKTFVNHKKVCANNARLEIIKYPRRCGKCKKFYSTRQSFSKHKQQCRLKRPIQSDPSQKTDSESELLPQEAKSMVKITYPRMCPVCGHSFLSCKGFSDHESLCYKRKAYEVPDSGVARVLKKPGEWIPVEMDSKRVLKYFVVNKTTPAQN